MTSMHFPIDLTWRYSDGELRQCFIADPLIVQSLNDTNIEGRYVGYKMSLNDRFQRLLFKDRKRKRRKDVIKMYGWERL